MSTPRVRFAVVGAGVIGKVHAKALSELAVVRPRRGVLRHEQTRLDRRDLFGQLVEVQVLRDDAVLQRDDVDAVCVCTPSGLHADGAVAALEAGKHVVVEKPLDVSLAAADRVIDAEKRSGKTVAVISQHRFDKSTEKLLEAVRDGHFLLAASEVLALQSNKLNPV